MCADTRRKRPVSGTDSSPRDEPVWTVQDSEVSTLAPASTPTRSWSETAAVSIFFKIYFGLGDCANYHKHLEVRGHLQESALSSCHVGLNSPLGLSANAYTH